MTKEELLMGSNAIKWFFYQSCLDFGKQPVRQTKRVCLSTATVSVFSRVFHRESIFAGLRWSGRNVIKPFWQQAGRLGGRREDNLVTSISSVIFRLAVLCAAELVVVHSQGQDIYRASRNKSFQIVDMRILIKPFGSHRRIHLCLLGWLAWILTIVWEWFQSAETRESPFPRNTELEYTVS